MPKSMKAGYSVMVRQDLEGMEDDRHYKEMQAFQRAYQR